MNLERNVVEVFYDRIEKFLTSSAEVLDVGSNIGRIGRLISPQVMAITLLDTDMAVLESAKKRFGEAKIENANFIHSDFSHLKTERKFDIILFFLSLHHIEDIESTFARCRILLKDGGLLIVGDFYTENILYPFHEYDRVPHNGFSLKKCRSNYVCMDLK
jgi:ubiquinone/menaquinone biosynthesis C-methylase UbiE